MDTTLIERLKEVKRLIALREYSALADVMQDIETAEPEDDRVRQVVRAVRHEAWGEAVALIETLLEDENAGERETDERDALRTEMERLRERLIQREEVRDELERTVRHFYLRYREELGPLVERLLELRKERFEQAVYRDRRSTRRRNAFHEARADYERFQEFYEETEVEEAPAELSDEEQKRLKSRYRQASKRCHPDMVEEADKEKAKAVFNELRDAYQRNDLEQVEKIAGSLDEHGLHEPEPDRQRVEALRATVEELHTRIDQVEDEIADLRASEAYQVISEVRDIDSYFGMIKQRLQREIRRIRRGFPVR